MSIRALALVGLIDVVVSVGAIGCAPPSGKVLSADQAAILSAHNAVRTNASPAPSPALAPLTWDDAAAAVASSYAAGCVFEHNANRGDLGENLAVFTDEKTAPADVVALWAAEASDYDLATNACAQNAECGHYTQLVWRATTSVGCAAASCPSIPGFGAGVLWVCDYAPPGNVVGEKPY